MLILLLLIIVITLCLKILIAKVTDETGTFYHLRCSTYLTRYEMELKVLAVLLMMTVITLLIKKEPFST